MEDASGQSNAGDEVINKFNRKNLPPEFELKVVTVQDIIDAIRKNGFDHLRSTWVHEDFSERVDGGCVLGQGAVNIGAASHDDIIDDLLYHFFRSDVTRYDQYNENELITYLQKFTLASQLDKVPDQCLTFDKSITNSISQEDGQTYQKMQLS
jgi:hypothetical protein